MALYAVSTPGTSINDPVAKSEVFFGLPGRIVDAIDPFTEAHPMAILSNTMVMFGNVIGRGPYFPVEYTRHHTKLNIGQTGRRCHANAWSMEINLGDGWGYERKGGTV